MDFWFGSNELAQNFVGEEKYRWDQFIQYGFRPESYVETRLDSATGPLLARREGNDIEWTFDVPEQPNPVVIKPPTISYSKDRAGKICYGVYYIKLYGGTSSTTLTTSTTTSPPTSSTVTSSTVPGQITTTSTVITSTTIPGQVTTTTTSPTTSTTLTPPCIGPDCDNKVLMLIGLLISGGILYYIIIK